MIKSYCWHRVIYNGYEPDNQIKFTAELIDDKEYRPFKMSGFLTFKDGNSVICVARNEAGTFDWLNDDKKGNSPTFDEAFMNMPYLVTHPDHWNETDIWEENNSYSDDD